MYVLPTGDVIYEMVEYDRPSVCHWLESSLKEHHSNFNQHFTISIYFQKKHHLKLEQNLALFEQRCMICLQFTVTY